MILIFFFFFFFISQYILQKNKISQCEFFPISCSPSLGTEETSCSSLGIGMLSHSCLIQASSCSTVLGLLCRIFLFMMRQMFSMGERSGLQAGHFITRILLLRSHDVVIDAVCGLALSCWKMQGLP